MMEEIFVNNVNVHPLAVRQSELVEDSPHPQGPVGYRSPSWELDIDLQEPSFTSQLNFDGPDSPTPGATIPSQQEGEKPPFAHPFSLNFTTTTNVNLDLATSDDEDFTNGEPSQQVPSQQKTRKKTNHAAPQSIGGPVKRTASDLDLEDVTDVKASPYPKRTRTTKATNQSAIADIVKQERFAQLEIEKQRLEMNQQKTERKAREREERERREEESKKREEERLERREEREDKRDERAAKRDEAMMSAISQIVQTVAALAKKE
jgi:hypothetical protein